MESGHRTKSARVRKSAKGGNVARHARSDIRNGETVRRILLRFCSSVLFVAGDGRINTTGNDDR